MTKDELERARIELVALARDVASLLVRYYDGELALRATSKSDGSPVTDADTAAEARIRTALERRWAEIPILSEETAKPSFEERSRWERFWLVDPLDGTRDFLARTGDFTVNIALIELGAPMLGVVAAPAHDVVWSAAAGCGAWVREGEGAERRIENRRPATAGDLIALDSRFHSAPELELFCRSHGAREVLRFGSALKFGKLAEGAADLYPRFTPTMEWDVAAGHAILREAGCAVVTLADRAPVAYNKQDLHMPPFLAATRAFLSSIDQRTRSSADDQGNKPFQA